MKLTPKWSTILGYASLILIGVGNLAQKLVQGEPVTIQDILILVTSVLPSATRSKR